MFILKVIKFLLWYSVGCIGFFVALGMILAPIYIVRKRLAQRRNQPPDYLRNATSVL